MASVIFKIRNGPAHLGRWMRKSHTGLRASTLLLNCQVEVRRNLSSSEKLGWPRPPKCRSEDTNPVFVILLGGVTLWALVVFPGFLTWLESLSP